MSDRLSTGRKTFPFLYSLVLLPIVLVNLIPEVVTSEVIFFDHISADMDAYDKFIVKTLVILNPRSLNHEDSDCQTPLHTAASRGNLDLVDFFIDRGADVNKTTPNCGYDSPLEAAVESGSHEIIKHAIVGRLLKAGARVTDRSIKYSSEKRDYDLEKALLSYKEKQTDPHSSL